MQNISVRLLGLTVLLVLGGCVTAPPKANFTQFRTENPHSILVVPAINKSVDVNAPDYFLATISEPLAERGYYVFPVNMVRSVLADDGLNDANLVHSGDPKRLGELFVADAISAAMTKAAPNYVPLAQQANAQAINTKGTGLPAGPHDALYLKDSQDF